jgi:[acyl-carrier-protein] S-malonyltransferase
MANNKKISFLFPGQGAQYVGMGKDFIKEFSAARLTFEEADEILGRHLSRLITGGPEDALTQTKNSQVAIYTVSIALWRVLIELYDVTPSICAGLSLGEYSALTAAGYLNFTQGLSLVQKRGDLMNEACEKTVGTMAVILGLDASVVEELVQQLHLPHDLWVANFNCPGQVVISGTIKGVEAGMVAAQAKGAKRVLPLQVHGAFHSGLMRLAEERLAPYIQHTMFVPGSAQIVMNATGDFVSDIPAIKEQLIKQVTHSVRWEQGIRATQRQDVDAYIEFGPGKTLSGMNRKIGVTVPTLSLENVADLDHIHAFLK